MGGWSKEDFTQDDIFGLAKAIYAHAKGIEDLGEAMKVANVDILNIKGVAELDRADERLGKFCDYGRAALRDATRIPMFRKEQESSDSRKKPSARRGRPPKGK